MLARQRRTDLDDCVSLLVMEPTKRGFVFISNEFPKEMITDSHNLDYRFAALCTHLEICPGGLEALGLALPGRKLAG